MKVERMQRRTDPLLCFFFALKFESKNEALIKLNFSKLKHLNPK